MLFQTQHLDGCRTLVFSFSIHFLEPGRSTRMKLRLISFVTLLVIATMPAMAADLAEKPFSCSLEDTEQLYGMTSLPKANALPNELCWIEERWVYDGCCYLWGLRVELRLQMRTCCERSGCDYWFNTSITDCTNYPCDPF
jgi:hypothetical protein